MGIKLIKHLPILQKIIHFIKPQKTKIVLFIFFILLIPWHYFIILMFADPFITDRGHESYSGTPLGELYELIARWTFFLPGRIISQDAISFPLTFLYWYILSCIIVVLYKKLRKSK